MPQGPLPTGGQADSVGTLPTPSSLTSERGEGTGQKSVGNEGMPQRPVPCARPGRPGKHAEASPTGMAPGCSPSQWAVREQWVAPAPRGSPWATAHAGPARGRAALCLRHQPQRQTGRDAPHTLAGTPVRFPALFLVQSMPAAVVQVLPTPTARMRSGLSPHTLGDPGRAQPSLPRVFHGSLSSICKPHLHPDTHAHCCLGPLTAPTPVPHSRGLPRADSRVLLLT